MALPGPAAEQWDRLAAASANVFATRAWSEIWWTHYGRGATPLVVADRCAQTGALRYLLPLCVSGTLLRQVRFLGNGPADQLGPLCAVEHREAAAARMSQVLRDADVRAHVLLAQNLRVAEGWDALLGGTVVREVGSPVVRLPVRDWQTYLAGRSKNFREQVRRRERRLRQGRDVQLRLADRESLGRDMQTLFRLHRARWGPKAPFASGTEARFHLDFARAALADDRLRLWVLEVEGAPAAALYGFRFAGVESFYQSGRDPAQDELSVGSVLLVHAIRSALEDGMREYRLLRGDEAYKSRLADHQDPVHSVAVAVGRVGRLAVSAARWRAAAGTRIDPAAAAAHRRARRRTP